jgi:hypothetical protein
MSAITRYDRRRFLSRAAMSLTATELAMIGFAAAKPVEISSAASTTIHPVTKNTFGTLKQIDAGLLNIGYAEDGPPDVPRAFADAIIEVDGMIK